MAEIRSLFDAARALNRPIEKVITYQHRSDKQLRAEISEYVATQHIVENFDRLLKLMQAVGFRVLRLGEKLVHQVPRLCPRPQHLLGR